MKCRSCITLLLILALLLGLMSGCGAETQTGSDAAANSASESTVGEAMEASAAEIDGPVPEEAAADTEPEDAEEIPEASAESEEPEEPVSEPGIPELDLPAADIAEYDENGYTLPMFEDTVTLSYWMPVEHDLANLVNSYEDMESYQWVEQNLNVDIQWTQCSQEAKSDQFNLMTASGDYCDLIDAVFELYAGGDDAAIEDEVIVALDDYVYDYMPFYSSYFSNDELRKAVLTDMGQVGSIYQIRAQKDDSLTNGPVVRIDWLEECGLPWSRENMPVTLDDWHEILTAFKNQYGAVTLWDPTGVEYIGAWGIYAAMPGGSGPMASTTADGYFYDDNGEIVYGPTCDRFRDYVELVSAWYAEGLIDPDFITATDRNYEYAMYSEGKTGLWGANNLREIMAADENIDQVITAIPNPIIDENSFVYGGYSSYAMRNATAVSTSCSNVEEALLFLDWFYTPAGSLFGTYGMEGITYNLDADGEPELTDLVLNNPAGLSDKVVICMYSTFGSYLYDVRYDQVGLTPTKQAFYDIWKSNWSPENPVIDTVALTSDEATEQTGILAEIGTYGGTIFLEWITGVRPLNDETWQEYVDACNSLGAERALEIEKTGLDRYNSI